MRDDSLTLATPIRLVAVDVDRTLLTDDYRLLAEVVEAVALARASGLRVVAATARSPDALRPIAAALGLADPCVCYNGAWTGRLDDGGDQLIDQVPMNPEMAARLIADAEALELNPCWFGPAGSFAHADGPAVQRELRATGLAAAIITDATALTTPVYKVLCLGAPGREAQLALLRATYGSHFEIARSDTYLLEATAPEVSKQVAVARLAEGMNLAAADTAAIGDSENDLALIAWAGLGISMGNGSDAVRQAADWHTHSNAQAGAAHALRAIVAANSSMGWGGTR